MYDIEVEGTHNFIGNDIVAHNTAFTAAASGATSTSFFATTLHATDLLTTNATSTALYISGSAQFANTGLRLADTNASHYLTLSPGSDLTADRTLTLTTGDAARTLTLNGNATLDDWFDQSVKTTASPSFAGLLVNGATSTITNLSMVNSTTTAATSTNLYTSGQTILAATGGNVGIGTTTPNYKLQIAGSSATVFDAFKIRTTQASVDGVGSRIVFSEAGDTAVGMITSKFDGANWIMQLGTNDLDPSLTLKAGKLGLGTTSPYASIAIVKDGLAAQTNFMRFEDPNTFGAGALGLTIATNNHSASNPGAVLLASSSLHFAVGNTQDTDGLRKMTIMASGNVGIGTTGPESKTQITGGGLCVGSDANCNTDNNTEGTIYSSNTAMTVYDVAENYPTRDSSVGPADIVALDPDNGVFVKKADSTSSPQARILGVISGDPAVLLGGFNGPQFANERQVAVGLSGRIPVKVSLEGGEIKIGDHLSLSSEPGVAKKAADGEQSIGYALEYYGEAQGAGNFGTGTIQFFITHGNMAGMTVADLTAALGSNTAQHEGNIGTGTALFLTNLFARLTEWLGDTANGIAKIVVETLTAKRVQTDELCVGDTCVTQAQFLQMVQTAGAAVTTSPVSAPEPSPAPSPEPTPSPEPSPSPEPQEPPQEAPQQEGNTGTGTQESPPSEEVPPSEESPPAPEPEPEPEPTPAPAPAPEPPPAEEPPAEEPQP